MSYELAHIRLVGQGSPGWGESQIWHLAGDSPTLSVYDYPDTERRDQGFAARIRDGVLTLKRLKNPGDPTMNRHARASAVQVSTPAAQTFQGYFSPTFSWVGMNPQISPRPLVQNSSPSLFGTKEAHRATVYNPVPSSGEIFPKYV